MRKQMNSMAQIMDQKMRIWRPSAAFLLAVLTTFILGVLFYTQQVLSKQAAIGADYTIDQQIATLFMNFTGLVPRYGGVLLLALLIAFPVAAPSAARATRLVWLCNVWPALSADLYSR